MTAREQLADVIEDAIDSVHDMDVTHRDYANAAADSVLGMIKDLEWVTHDSVTSFAIRRYSSKDYIIEERKHGNHFDLWIGVNATKAARFDTLEAAKDAANAHHRAQVLAALGIMEKKNE